LLEAAHGDTEKVSPARYDKPVEGTDITYEDVSLKFLYWPVAKIDGSETVDGLNCWKLHLEPGGQPSAYAVVLLWVSKRTGDFLEGEGYDMAGKLVKRFKVVSGQRDPNGGWMLKKMRIETLAEGKGESITYLEIDK
jgi:Outer membrane lipoprotein-sorting protein